MSAVSMIGSFTEGLNKIKHIGPDILQIGPHYHAGVQDSTSLERTQTFIDLYNAGGAKECTLAPDMPNARYRKLLWNGTFNTVCALMQMNVEELQRSGARETLIIPIMREIAAVAEAEDMNCRRTLFNIWRFVVRKIQFTGQACCWIEGRGGQLSLRSFLEIL